MGEDAARVDGGLWHSSRSQAEADRSLRPTVRRQADSADSKVRRVVIGILSAHAHAIHSTLDMQGGAWDGSLRCKRPTEIGPNLSKRRFAKLGNEVNKKMKISGAQVKAARELLKISRPELARAAGISERTLRRFETDEDIPKADNIEKIVRELDRRGIEFTNGSGIGVRLIFDKAAEFARMSASSRSER